MIRTTSGRKQENKNQNDNQNKNRFLIILALMLSIFLALQLSVGTIYATDSAGLTQSDLPTITAIDSNTAKTKVSRIADSDRIASASYLDFIAIPSSYFTATNNGGEAGSGTAFSKAFDRSFATHWESKLGNNCNNNGATDVNFHNTVNAVFNAKVRLDRLLYQCENYSDGRGYPCSLKIHLFKDGEHIKSFTFNSTSTTQKTLFEFGETVECDSLQLEWVQVNTNHRYNVTAREIIFLQPDMEIPELFTDFCELTLDEKYDTQEELNALKEQLSSNPNYEGTIKANIERAERIISGELKWEKRRQMSVAPEQGEPTLRQEGDMQSYMRDTLDFGWYGTNKQIIGVSGQKGETITIYVDAKAGDPLPKVICTQYFGHWSGWQTNEIPLSLGKNTITIPTWDESKLTYPYQQISGGPIYISNPYKSGKQSSEVKVYVEGGQTFPIFRKGDNVDAYLKELKAYVEKRNSDAEYKQKTYDLTEFESNYTQMTIKASLANSLYSNENNTIDPQKNLENWDVYMRSLLAFDGVDFDKKGLHYAEENEHLRLNFRLAQPVGAAFGSNSQVGIFTDDWISSTIVHGGNLGWGFAHEIGHTMDTWQLNIGESTNNMISKYDETVRGAASRGNFSTDIDTLSSDRAYAATKASNPDYTYFDTNRLNFLVWWHVESLHPGTWGKVKNYLRYPDNNELGLKLSETTKGMSTNEKNIYYFCIASGVDLGEYFERFGYRLNTSEALFTVEAASEAYKAAIQSAKDADIIKEKECTRYWYLDAAEYNYVTAGKATDLYKKTDKATIKSVKKVSGGNLIVMPKQSEAAHLGYEILEGSGDEFEIIGFTNKSSFKDSSTYEEGYTPSYKVRAVDRALNYSGLSEPSQAEQQSGVCRIGESYYDSLSAAISAAAAGATITLVKDMNLAPLTVNKNLTITAESNVSIKRADGGDLISVTGGTLTINGNGLLTIDGESFEQAGSLIYLNGGSLSINSTTMKNNDTTTNGGAIRASKGKLSVESCTIKDNSANSGGGICVDSQCEVYYIKNTKIENNAAKYNGGGIFSSGGGIIWSTEGCSISGNSAANGGGLWLDGRSVINKASVNNNKASQYGGGIWVKGSNASRIDDLTELVLEGNAAGKGGDAIYVEGGETQLRLNAVSLVSTEGNKASVYVKQGKSVGFTNTDVPALEFPNSKTISIRQEESGILIKQNETEVDVGNMSSGAAVLPVISLGSKTINKNSLKLILSDTGGELKSYSVGNGDHIGRMTAANPVHCVAEGNTEFYSCIVHDGEYFSDAACTKSIEENSWILPIEGHAAQKTEAKAATYRSEGNSEYWHCSSCDEYFSDKDCTEAIEKDSWIIPRQINTGVENLFEEDRSEMRLAGSNRYETALKAANSYKTALGVDSFENAVVACGTNFPDALAGGYLAKLAKAPVLLTAPDQDSKIVKYIRNNVEGGGTVYILGGKNSVSESFEQQVRAAGYVCERLGGSDRYETNLLILEECKKFDEAAAVKDLLVSTGANYPDSLSASACGRPILLVGEKKLNSNQIAYLEKLDKNTNVYVLGGKNAVSDKIMKEIEGLVSGSGAKERLAGDSRYETSAMIAEKFFKEKGAEVMVFAVAGNFPDGLSGSSLALALDAPIVLTTSDNTAAAEAVRPKLGATKSVALGGAGLISDAAIKRIMGRS